MYTVDTFNIFLIYLSFKCDYNNVFGEYIIKQFGVFHVAKFHLIPKCACSSVGTV